MLNRIEIRDLAVVENLDVELNEGVTVLTGETGAGKSILVDALGLALGDRGDAGMVRPGADGAEINLVVDLSRAGPARAWLAEQDLDTGEDECFVRRTLSAEGRSRGYVNGRAVPMQSLRELGERLVDIHGQHEHQSLTRRAVQRDLLDAYAGQNERREALAETYARWRAAADELERLRGADQERADRAELLRYQIQELEALGLAHDEPEALAAEQRQLAHADELVRVTQGAIEALYESENGSAHGAIGHVASDLRRLAELDERLAGAVEHLDGALIQLGEGVDELRRYLDRVDVDPERLEAVEQRLADVHDLARKHRCEPDELPSLAERLRAELDGLDRSGERLAELERESRELGERYHEQAAALSEARGSAAGELGARIGEQMERLGMPGGRLEVEVAADPDHPGPAGYDRVELNASANPGMPARPLAKVASGGELSRISLAIQVVTAGGGALPTLVFDEVDTGVGGAVAEVVGQLLRRLGDRHQVLCVTHLAQVAAQGHHQFRIVKGTDAGVTRTAVEPLGDGARVEELARMLGGVEITEQTRAHAREMLERAQASGKGKKRSRRKAASSN